MASMGGLQMGDSLIAQEKPGLVCDVFKRATCACQGLRTKHSGLHTHHYARLSDANTKCIM